MVPAGSEDKIIKENVQSEKPRTQGGLLMDKGQSIRSLKRCDQRVERTSMECCLGNQQRLLSGKLTGNAAGRSQ